MLISQAGLANHFSNTDYVSDFVENLNRVQLQQDTSYKLAGNTVADSCVALMNKDQFLGQDGRATYNRIVKNAEKFPNLLEGGSLNHYCRQYSRMEVDEKAMVWVLVLTMMAHFESSCKLTAKAKGPNGTARGYYQLHQGREGDYDGPTKACAKNASLNGKLSSECTLGMIEIQLDRDHGQLFSSKSYWDVLRPRGAAKKADDIQRALLKSSLCNPTSI